jgi:Mn2+/Fe2+ NRAMP family transporter
MTLFGRGGSPPATSAEVASALEPVAGRYAVLLYTLGIVGTGLLAIPTLAGSAAYAFAEVFGWRQGIDQRVRRAPAFYAVLVLSLALGVALDAFDVNAVRALFWSAVLNGLLAPWLLLGVLWIASDRALMSGQPSPRSARVVVAITAVVMLIAGGAAAKG